MSTPTPSSQPAARSASRRILIAISFVALAGIILYALTPTLISRGLPELAARYGLSLQIDMQHPGWRTLMVNELQLGSEGWQLQSRNLQLTYNLANLLQGHLQQIHIESIAVTTTDQDNTAAPQAAQTDAPSTPSLAPLFASLPAEAIKIADLTVRVPHLNFVGQGTADVTHQQAQVTLNGVSPQQAQDFVVDIDARPDDTLRFSFMRSGDNAQQLLQVDVASAGPQLRINAALNLSGLALDLFAHVAGLPAGDGQITGAGEFLVPYQLADQPQSTNALAAAYLASIEATAPGMDISWRNHDSSMQVDLSGHNLTLMGGQVTGVLSGNIKLQAGDYHTRIKLPTDFTLQFQHNMLTTSKLDVDVRSNALQAAFSPSLQVSTTPPLMMTATGDLWVQAGNLGTRGSLQAQAAVQQPSPLLVTAAVNLSGEATLSDYQLPHSLSAQVTLANSQIGDQTEFDVDVTGALGIGQQVTLPLQVSHHINQGMGRLRMQGATRWQTPLLQSIMPNWSDPIDFPRGALATRLDISWQPHQPPSGSMTLSLDDADMRSDDTVLQGITGKFDVSMPQLDNLDQWHLSPAPVSAAALDVGVPVTNIQTTLSGTSNLLALENTSARLLGGSIEIQNAQFAVASGSSRLTVEVIDLALAEVLALEGDNISGTGRLSGTIPLTIATDQITVTAGQITAGADGGTIRLSPDLTAPTGREELDFALKALENFTYTRLQSGIDYQANGDLQLTINLLGTNPDFERGRPVNYNLQVSENIPILLESLRIQDTFTNRIENAVQQ